MHRARGVAAGIALSVAACNLLPACSFDAVGGTAPNGYPDGTTKLDPYQGINPTAVEFGDVTRKLISKDAPVNLIVMKPSVMPRSFEDTGLNEDLAAYSRVASRNPSTLERIRQSFGLATSGLYDPKEVVLTDGATLDGIDCLDSTDTDQTVEISTAAKPALKPGFLNILVIGIKPCQKGVGGYARVGGLPILTLSGPSISGVYVHEGVGHPAGLGHATVAECVSNLAVRNCTPSESPDDPVSVMGYEDMQHFSAPELLELGLLDQDSFVVEPKAGTYEIGTVQNTDKPTKALVLNTDEGKMYISWEADPDAAYDTNYKAYDPVSPDSRASCEDNSTYISVVIPSLERSDAEYCKTKINPRPLYNSLQLRLFGAEQNTVFDSSEIVLRPSRTQAPKSAGLGNTDATGEVRPDTIVYNDGKTVVKLVGAVNDYAVVEVTRQ